MATHLLPLPSRRARSWLVPLFALGLAALGACATGIDPSDERSTYDQLETSLHDLQKEQRRFAAANVTPQVFDFPGQGRVTVREVSLDGYPGNTYVRARWNYRNTTGKPVVRAFVSLDVIDAEGRMVASKVCVCIFPSIRPLYEGTYYADELRTQTRGAHLQPGWHWRVTCRAEFYTETELEPGHG